MQLTSSRGRIRLSVVSILTHGRAWVQREKGLHLYPDQMGFNPHPRPSVGATPPPCEPLWKYPFQSSPTAERGCNTGDRGGGSLGGRGFQSSPTAERGCNRRSPAQRGAREAGFNPHPRPSVGATPAPLVEAQTQERGFNPHPRPSVGATRYGRGNSHAGFGVSILTHGRAWVQRNTRPDLEFPPYRFQSSPTAERGCNIARATAGAAAITGFNPHPRPSVGATVLPAYCRPVVFEFQSSPTAERGCNPRRRRRPRSGRRRFNPHPRPSVGAT